MNKVYQNGDLLLGTKKDLKMYNETLYFNKTIDKDTYMELEHALLNYKDDSILLVDCGYCMDLNIKEFDDVVWFEKEEN